MRHQLVVVVAVGVEVVIRPRSGLVLPELVVVQQQEEEGEEEQGEACSDGVLGLRASVSLTEQSNRSTREKKENRIYATYGNGNGNIRDTRDARL